jgi:hypothetical protein
VEMLDYKTRAHYWEAQFNKFKSREDHLKIEVEALKAKLRKREQQLFGKRSERSSPGQDKFDVLESTTPKRKKGQQIGSKGHGKRDYSDLPAVEEVVGLFEKDAICRSCQFPYEELAGTEDSCASGKYV